MSVPLFSRRHYEWIARYWRGRHNGMDVTAWRLEVYLMAAALKQEQHTFSMVKFLQACGLSRRDADKMLEGEL